MPKYTSRETLLRRQKQRKARRLAFISLAIIFVLAISLLITFIIGLFSKEETTPSYFLDTQETPAPETSQSSTPVLYPRLPLLEEQVILSSNSSNLALSENGRVHLEYFDDAVFLGDSLADGFYEYQKTTGIDTATFFTNVSLQPSSFLNGNYVNVRAYEEPVDAMAKIKEIQPGKIYIILGTNAMNLSDEEFLADYTLLIDSLKQASPNSVIYINSLTPVTAQKSAENPIYDANRIISLNNSLAKLASSKSISFVNTYEIFATMDGHLNEDLNYDGIHLTPTGYKNWADYLLSHTFYDENSPFVIGSPYIKPE